MASAFNGLDLQNSLAERHPIDDRLSQTKQRLASGFRINSTKDDPGGAAEVSKLTSDAAILDRGSANSADSFDAYSKAGAGAEYLAGLVMRIQALAGLALKASTTSDQRAALDADAEALVSEYNKVVQETEHQGRYLLSGTAGELRVQAGFEASTISDHNLQQDLTAIDLSSQYEAGMSYYVAASALQNVSTDMGALRGSQTRLYSAVEVLAKESVLTTYAYGRIRDVDSAFEEARKTGDKIRLDQNTAILAQANITPDRMLSLLQGSPVPPTPGGSPTLAPNTDQTKERVRNGTQIKAAEKDSYKENGG